MQIYLIRHAHALDAASDEVRPLSPKGLKQVKRIARFLRESDQFEPEEIWHSPLVRAIQTAAMLTKALETDFPRREVAGLKPEDDPVRIARQLNRVKTSVAVVGHEPHLSALASLLVVGQTGPAIFELKKCSVLALERETERERWLVRWQISPDVIARKR